MSFPLNPTDKQQYSNALGTLYQYDSTRTAWLLASAYPCNTFSWVIAAPAVGGVAGPQLYENRTVNRISSYVTSATNCTFNLQYNASPGTGGTNILSADQTAVTAGASATSFAHSSLTANQYLWLNITGVSGTPAQLEVSLTTTKAP